MSTIKVKTPEEIEIMREGAKILRAAHEGVKKYLKEGVTTAELDRIAEDIIVSAGAKPSFKGFGGFPATLCTMINEEVVHGIPGERKVRRGDLISVDCGVFWKGFHTDAAFSLVLGGQEAHPQREMFQLAVKEALLAGCRAAKAGARLSNVGIAISEVIKRSGYRIIKEFTGHGIGQGLHEAPHVYNFKTDRENMILKENMTLCLEPIVAFGKAGTFTAKDQWTVITKDRKDACQWEHCGRVTKDGLEIFA